MNDMRKSINELKIKAKILMKNATREFPQGIAILAKYNSKVMTSDAQLKLKHCYISIAREFGFKNWQHAQSVLSSGVNLNKSEDNSALDMGELWYKNHCNGFLNLWFSDYIQAKKAALLRKESYIIPYKRQFNVVDTDYIKSLNLDDGLDVLWKSLNRDLVASYPSDAWDEMAFNLISRYRISDTH